MTQDVRHILQRAESLVGRGLYAESLEVLREINCRAVVGEAFARYSILIGESLIKLGSFDHDHIDRAIAYYRSTAENALYARAKFLKGCQLQSLGLNLQAKETWLEAYAAFLKVEDSYQAAATQNRLAQLCHIQGDSEQAVHSLRKCVLHLEETGDIAGAAVIRGNLALTCWRCGRLSQSLQTYATALTTISDLKPQNRFVIRLGMTAATALSGDLRTALTQIVTLEEETAEFTKEHIIAFEYSGWIHLLAGKHKQAEIALSKGLKLALETAPESALISQIKRLFGDLYVATEKYDLAEQYAREALAVAEKLTERLEIAACHRVFAQVEQARGNGDKARHWYAQAIDLFSQIGARYELATTRLLLGSSDLCATGERSAMLYLAKEYFESEKLKHLTKQVDAHLFRSSARPLPRVTLSGDAPVIIGKSKAISSVLETASFIADCDMTILLTGATGTGKDLLARYIHYLSGRTGEFVSVNAAAVPVSMIESELFGHVKGSFTGAESSRKGLFEQADSGTFYLNEIADASPEFQAKLLDVLETRTIRRLGRNESRHVNFRLIAATNHDLEQLVREDRFRCDLYHRLRQVPVVLPSLDERRDDIPALTEHFLTIAGADLGSVRPATLKRLKDLLLQRDWPGNVRELRAVVMGMHAMYLGDIDAMNRALAETAQESECDRLLRVLESTGWNRTLTAELLGVCEGTVRHRIKKYELSELVESSQEL